MPTPKKIGLIAGGGFIPALFQEYCEAQGADLFTIGLGQYCDIPCDIKIPLGKSGQIVRELKDRDIHDLVIIGRVKRPSLRDLKPDIKTTKFFTKVAWKSLGDDGLLKALRTEIEEDGFTIHAVQDFMPDLLTPEGALGEFRPTIDQERDIKIGIVAALKHGKADKGQSILVWNGNIIGKEDIKGTDAMIEKYARDGAILIKMCKPGQDRALDLPTVGPKTIEVLKEHRCAGLAVHAAESLMPRRAEVIRLADEAGIFVIGVKP